MILFLSNSTQPICNWDATFWAKPFPVWSDTTGLPTKNLCINSSGNLRFYSFCSVKDKIPVEQKNNVIYKIRCPGCGEDYIGKTDCCFGKRMHEQGNKPEQPMFQHLQKCEEFNHLISLNALPDIDGHNYVIIRKEAHISETIKNNSKVIKTSRDWLELCYLETFLIKKYKSEINHGIKAARELQLF